ncbi:DUF6338 family protein [Nonomuraea sp. CA-143628]|uniref:DUF6338 family protein n=1 Tax=Nonomuraea sp. CA-143628 TaxID=3239997 RepID=UPI003D92D412
MPTSVPALLLFVVLLLPGFVYVLVWERKAPHRRPSTFRETALVVFGSVLAELTVLALFFAFRAVVPAATPDVGRLVREGSRYASVHWVSLTWWGIALLAAATLLAALIGRWAAARPHPSAQSAWFQLFADRPRQMAAACGELPSARVCCFLDDGSQFEGTLAWFNQLSGDVTDRDLILVAPLIRWDETGGKQELAGHAVCLSARSVRAIQVCYELPPPSVAAGDEPSVDVGAGAGEGAGAGSTISDPGGAAGVGAGQATGSG